MKKKYFILIIIVLIILLFVFYLFYPKTTHIKIKNSSNQTYENLTVGQHYIGTLEPGQETDYLIYADAYALIPVKLESNEEPYIAIPIDYVGEDRLKRGNYIYEINITNKRLAPHMKKN